MGTPFSPISGSRHSFVEFGSSFTSSASVPDWFAAYSRELPKELAPAPGVNVFETGSGKENGQLNFPRGLAIDSSGNILVSDTNNGRIQKFSPTGAFLSVFGKTGQGPGEFREPGGIAVDASGNIYVADVANNRVQKLKPDGTFIFREVLEI